MKELFDSLYIKRYMLVNGKNARGIKKERTKELLNEIPKLLYKNPNKNKIGERCNP
jgi:hypothetical protein